MGPFDKTMSSKYSKLELIREGTLGHAWLVRKKDTQKTVEKKYVVKELHVQGMSDAEKDQTLIEVKTLAKRGVRGIRSAVYC